MYKKIIANLWTFITVGYADRFRQGVNHLWPSLSVQAKIETVITPATG